MVNKNIICIFALLNENITIMLKKFMEWFESDEGKKSIEEKERKDIFLKSLNQKYFNKLNLMSKEERKNLCLKIRDKYESKKYKDKEYKMGMFPRNELYFLLFEYASIYGKEHEPRQWFFPSESYIIDNSIVMEVLIGQGNICNMYLEDE